MCSLEKHGNLFLLTITGRDEADEHRLNSTVISSIQSALSAAKSQSTPGSVLITMAQQGKYFCNGFDINPSSSSESKEAVCMSEMLKHLAADFLSLPMPTIAIVTGHAVGAGLGLVICHDYVFMRRDGGILCMIEIDKGISLPEYAVELIRSKVVDPKFVRDILLRGKRMKAEEAVAMGVVTMGFDSRESAVEGGMRMGEELGKWELDGQVCAERRRNLYPQLCRMLGLMGSNHLVNSRL